MATVYIYSADILCESCGEAKRAELDRAGERPDDVRDECTYDSDDYPKGPTDEGESDSPTHCGGCGEFLETDLTSDGRRYVAEAIAEAIGALPTWQSGELAAAELARDGSVALATWCAYYSEPIDGPALAALWGNARSRRAFLRAELLRAERAWRDVSRNGPRIETADSPRTDDAGRAYVVRELAPDAQATYRREMARAAELAEALAAAMYGSSTLRAFLRDELGARSARDLCGALR